MESLSQTIEAPRRWRWDPLVRLTHWGIAIAVTANALFTEEGSNTHVWIGYGLAALLALRLVWGLIGPKEARFTAFPPNPVRAIGHIGAVLRGEKTQHRSHNPLGALNVYAMWACLAAVIGTGVAMAGPPSLTPVAAERGAAEADGGREGAGAGGAGEGEGEGEGQGEGEGGDEMLEELHEAAVYLLYLLIALHLGGVLFESSRHGGAVVARMMPGRSRKD